MIHICRVDIGCRNVFDMVADNIDDVSSLKSAIEKHNGININDQILLISGGEVLQNKKQKLFGLSAGIEESPIYLIDLNNIKKYTNTQIDLNQLLYNVRDMSCDIDMAINMNASYQTLQLRTKLAYDVYDHSSQLNELCETYYHDQYWQYQGYLAVVANLDEHLISFRNGFDKTKEQYLSFFNNKKKYFEILNEVEEYVDLLKHLRLIPQITDNAKNVQLFNSFCSQTNLAKLSTSSSNIAVQSPPSRRESIASPPPFTFDQHSNTEQSIDNLYEWTNSTDPRHKLDVILIKAKESISCLSDDKTWLKIEEDVERIFNEANNKQKKEIEGLTKRLCDLNMFLENCKICLTRLKEVADSFKQHQINATKLKDDTILQDLCNGHEKSLLILKENHVQILDMTRKIARAKIELIRVINSRLHNVMNIQTNMISDSHVKLVMTAEQIKQINRYLKQIEQLKNAPEVYLLALNETIRRERFSTLYKTFSKHVHQISNDLCKIEIEKREKFNKKFLHNYIANLFPYLQEKKPVEFVKSELNLNYDMNIPQLNEMDIKNIEFEMTEYLGDKKSKMGIFTNDLKIENNEPEKFYLKLIEILNKFLNKNISLMQLQQQQQKTDQNSTNELYLSDEQIIQQSSTDVLTNDDLILVNTKPSANLEFLNKLNQIFSVKVKELRDIFNEENLKFKTDLNEMNGNIGRLIEHFKSLCEKQNEEKEFIYKKILENLFSTKSNEGNVNDGDFEDILKRNKADEEFYLSLKENLLKLRQAYEKSMDDNRKSLDTYKKCMNADRQRFFNEAIQKCVDDKKKLESDFKIKEENYIKELKEKDDKLQQFTSLIDKEDALQRQVQREQRLMDKIHFLEKQLHKFTLSSSTSSLVTQGQPQSSPSLQSGCDVSLCTNASSSPSCQNFKSFMVQQQSKNEEVVELNSCYTGDLVIAIYDQAHSAYRIINKSSPYKHFVHTDSIKIFETQTTIPLKSDTLPIDIQSPKPKSFLSSPSPLSHIQTVIAYSPSSPASASPQTSSLTDNNTLVSTAEQQTNFQSYIGNASHTTPVTTNKQPSWFIARVCSKEFCVAKKENNRYKVPANTRFYRVKIEPYKL